MELPRWNQLLLSALKAYSDGKPHVNRDIKVLVANNLGLSDEQREEKTALHGENKIEGRVGWAISALKIAGLLENFTRGSNVITDSGKRLLSSQLDQLTEQFLEDNFPSYRENKEAGYKRHRNKRNSDEYSTTSTQINDYTPEEVIDTSINTIESQLRDELITRLYTIDPYRFEEIVADLLAAMGYGDLTVTRKSSDGGIDAVVNEDKLGLDKILVQAKRYAKDNIVNELAVRNFAGALATSNVNKGIFVTTSSFSKKSAQAVNGMQMKLILIDGNRLTQLMIENNIGVAVEKSYFIKHLDSDYFDN